MLRLRSIVSSLLLLILFGCAGDMDLRLRQQREEIYTEVQRQLSEIRSAQNEMKKEINDIKKTQERESLELNKNLVDQQKQIFSDRAVLDETSKRVYFLESIITTRTPIAPQMKDVFVTFVQDDEASISAGSVSGVRTGDCFGVYKNAEKIGTIRIDIVEVNSSKGQITNKTQPVSIGDRVEMEKKESKEGS